MNPFTLDGNGPAFRHPDKAAFNIPPAYLQLRQTIWNHLQANLGQAYLLSDLVKLTGSPIGKVYRASRMLVRHGLAVKKDIWLPKPTKADPEKKKPFPAIEGLAPFSARKEGKW